MRIITYTLALLLISFSPDNFRLGSMCSENGSVYFRIQKDDVEDVGQEVDKIIAKVIAAGGEVTEKKEGSTSLKVSDYHVNYRKQGGTQMGTALYIQGEMSFVCKIECKEDRYRVTITNMLFKDNLTLDLGEVEAGPTTTPIEQYILKRTGDFRSSQKRYIEYIDKDLVDLFTVPEPDDW